MNNGQIFGTPASGTATGTTGATANIVVGANQTAYITDASGSSDNANAVIFIYDNVTPLWQNKMNGSTPYVISFATPLKATMGNTLSVVVANTTGAAKANISGYISNNS